MTTTTGGHDAETSEQAKTPNQAPPETTEAVERESGWIWMALHEDMPAAEYGDRSPHAEDRAVIGPGVEIKISGDEYWAVHKNSYSVGNIAGVDVRVTEACPEHLVVMLSVGAVVVHRLLPPEDA